MAFNIRVTVFALLLILSICQVNSLGSQRSKVNPKKLRNRSIFNWKSHEEHKASYKGPEPFTFTTRLDHFNNSQQPPGDTTFEIRYILNEEFNSDGKGPILFYAGNEGSIEAFYDNSGFLTTTLAKELNATVLFGEHRYYGDSYPYGNKTKAFERENLKYLSVEQVMMDYVGLVEHIKQKDPRYDNNTGDVNPRTPVYVFGGSYGGMLATWLRMKYPTHFHGAIASSAPILWFRGATDPNAYTKIASQVLKDIWGDDCYAWQSRGFYDLIQAQQIPNTYAGINRFFNVCADSAVATPEDVDVLIENIADSLGTMAMVNYPYATDFVRQLPAWPVHAACYAASAIFEEPKDDPDPREYNNLGIQRLAALMSVWTGNGTCLNLTSDDGGALDALGWDVQTCYEFPMPMGDDPSQSAYTWTSWYEEDHTNYCQLVYGLTPDYDWALDFFGGREPRRDFLDYTNIVWVNGDYDPWHGGGVTTNITSGTTALYVKQAAHHYDLREPNAADTVQIKEARAVETMHLQKWIADWKLNIIY